MFFLIKMYEDRLHSNFSSLSPFYLLNNPIIFEKKFHEYIKKNLTLYTTLKYVFQSALGVQVSELFQMYICDIFNKG